MVVLASLGVALTANALSDELVSYREIGAIVGTSASALFLFVIAIANLVVLRGVYRAFRVAELGDRVTEAEIDALLQQRGWLARVFRPLFRFVSQSWHLYPIGLLFALGFETRERDQPVWPLGSGVERGVQLVAPDFPGAVRRRHDAGRHHRRRSDAGRVWLGVSQSPCASCSTIWSSPRCRCWWALVVGGIETLGLIAGQLQLHGRFWNAVSDLNDNFGALGYGIVALFVVSWAVSFLIYRFKRYDLIGAGAEPGADLLSNPCD